MVPMGCEGMILLKSSESFKELCRFNFVVVSLWIFLTGRRWTRVREVILRSQDTKVRVVKPQCEVSITFEDEAAEIYTVETDACADILFSWKWFSLFFLHVFFFILELEACSSPLLLMVNTPCCAHTDSPWLHTVRNKKVKLGLGINAVNTYFPP